MNSNKELKKVERSLIRANKNFKYISKTLKTLKEIEAYINEQKIIVDPPIIVEDLFSLSYKKNDLCKEYVDAIVNPANERLEHAGGAALAICNAGGVDIENESNKYINEHGKLPTG